MEMTDLGGQENQDGGGADKKNSVDHHVPEHFGAQRGLGTPKQHLYERHGSSSNVEGFEDFEEFVLDFDDYDLLESIHTQLGSPLEPIRKLRGFVQMHVLALQFCCLFHPDSLMFAEDITSFTQSIDRKSLVSIDCLLCFHNHNMGVILDYATVHSIELIDTVCFLLCY